MGWELLLRNYRWPTGSSLLLPAYIGYSEREGSGVFDPVLRTHTPYTFYPLDEYLRIDLGVLEERLLAGKHPMLLVVHYFGLAHGDMDEIKKLCRKYGTALVEDCAHVLGPFEAGHPLGSFGDAAFYSLHKMFAVPDGGVLRMNSDRLCRAEPQDSERCVASTLEQVASTDVSQVVSARRANYAFLARRLASVEGVEVLYPEIGTAVPHDFPIRVFGGLRERLYFELNDQDVPAIALYYRMIDAISPAEFPISYKIAGDILNLPVHQDVGEAGLAVAVDKVSEILNRLRA